MARVRGTKNPDLAAIRALSPDLVVANQEENRELDVRRLRDAGVAVWVTRIETVEESLDAMSRLFVEALGLADPDWLVEAARALVDARLPRRLSRRRPDLARPVDGRRVAAPTPTTSCARAGLVNVLADGPAERDGRYPTVSVRARSTPPAPTSCCCPTSPTSSPPTTARRRSGPRRDSCRGGC